MLSWHSFSGHLFLQYIPDNGSSVNKSKDNQSKCIFCAKLALYFKELTRPLSKYEAIIDILITMKKHLLHVLSWHSFSGHLILWYIPDVGAAVVGGGCGVSVNKTKNNQ